MKLSIAFRLCPVLIAITAGAQTADTQYRPDMQYHPLTVYAFKPADAEPVRLKEGTPFSIPLADIPEALADQSTAVVRVFEGSKADLISHHDVRLGDCYRYDAFLTQDARINGSLNLPYFPSITDAWLNCSGGQCRSKRFVLVPDDGAMRTTQIYLDEASIATYFNKGIEIEITPDETYARSAPVVVPPSPAVAPAPASTAPMTSAGPVPPLRIDCIRLSSPPSARNTGASRPGDGAQIAQVRTCAVL